MKLSFAMFSLNNFQLSWGDWGKKSKAKACLIPSEKSFVVHKIELWKICEICDIESRSSYAELKKDKK